MQQKICATIRLLFILAIIPFPAFAQYAGLPKLAVGLSAGYETGDLNGQNIDGLYLQGRLGGVFKTYPILFVGVDVKYSFPTLDTPDGSLDGNNFAIGPMAGFMVPFDLFFNMEGQPRGAGMPIYVAYNFVDHLSFDGVSGNIDAQSLKIGVQMPLPLNNLPVFLALQAEYLTYFFDDNDPTPGYLPGTDLDRTNWQFMFQVGIPLSVY
ncbi:MAG: hypothetical protein ACE5G1_14665 [bacterium]